MLFRSRRTELGLTRKELAVRAGLSARFLSDLEAGRANIAIGRLASVAAALSVKIVSLVDDRSDEGLGPKRGVGLLGLRGAGKTSLGARVSAQLGLPFVELDHRIEDAAGLSRAEIFSLHGEVYYRRLEFQCLCELLADGKACVLALSGGVVRNEPAFELAREQLTTVWLSASPEEHMARVLGQGDRRPVADRADAMDELRAILAARQPLYRLADLVVDTAGQSEDASLTTLAASLGEAGWS